MGYGSVSQITPPQEGVYFSITSESRVDLMPESRVYYATENTPLLGTRLVRSVHEFRGIWKVLFLLGLLVLGVVIGTRLLIIEYGEDPGNFPFHLIDRNFWYKGAPIATHNLTALNSSQVSHLVLFHTRSDHCDNFHTCLRVIREMTNPDTLLLPFNFLIGGDGKTYEMRGWSFQSGFEHIPFNNESLTVGFIGDFTHVKPSRHQVYEVGALIAESVRRKKLKRSFKIHGLKIHGMGSLGMYAEFSEWLEWAGWV